MPVAKITGTKAVGFQTRLLIQMPVHLLLPNQFDYGVFCVWVFNNQQVTPMNTENIALYSLVALNNGHASQQLFLSRSIFL